MVETYFFDTYALVEIDKGNENYAPYKKANIITTILNVMELYSSLFMDLKREEAEEGFEYYSESCVSIPDEVYKEAVLFRLKMMQKFRKKEGRPNYINCIGYVIAKRMGIKFLTGDKLFENLDFIEFVK